MEGKRQMHTGNGHLSYVKQHSCLDMLDAKGIGTNWQSTKTGNNLDMSRLASTDYRASPIKQTQYRAKGVVEFVTPPMQDAWSGATKRWSSPPSSPPVPRCDVSSARLVTCFTVGRGRKLTVGMLNSIILACAHEGGYVVSCHVVSQRYTTAWMLKCMTCISLHVVHELATDPHREIEPTHCRAEHGNRK